MSLRFFACLTLVIVALPGSARSQWVADVETGLAAAIYNDVQVPNSTGTRFSLTDELETASKIFVRLEGGRRFGERHQLTALYAPLELDAAGTVDRPILFEGVEFPAGTPLAATYRFDSYRVRYLYDLARSDRLVASIGATAKIRDAEIALVGGGQESRKTNTGFVPLVAFRIDWLITGSLSLLVRGDALVGPQGRAEDVLFGAAYALTRELSVKGGYRLLEGGADVDEVYNFSAVQYGVAGIIINL
jgi:hypothetical protein